MKLVEILARELGEWPENVTHAIQEGVDKYHRRVWTLLGDSANTIYESGEWLLGHTVWPVHGHSFAASDLASDYETAIITRYQWQAERDRIAAAGKPKEAKWIRHRGGKCPVADGVKIQVRYRDGLVRDSEAGDWYSKDWNHDGVDRDIMAYRIIEEEKQEMAGSANYYEGKDAKIEYSLDGETFKPLGDGKVFMAAQSTDGPLDWRDRIREIDAYMIGEKEAHKRLIESAETERAELVAKLAAEGLALCGEPVKAVEPIGAWRVGDLLKITKEKHGHEFTIGEVVSIGEIDSDPTEETPFKCWHADKSDFWYVSSDEAEFHHRP